VLRCCARRAEDDIDGFIALDVEIIACANFGVAISLNANTGRGMLNFCISDAAKLMLLTTPGFIPHLVNALLLDPEHPRNVDGSPEAVRAIVQRDFAECIQQLSLFAPGCEALKSAGIVEALDMLVDKAWTEEAKDSARGALMQLTDRHHREVTVDLDATHIMMSCKHSARLSYTRC
jgi:hypothetical protein